MVAEYLQNLSPSKQPLKDLEFRFKNNYGGYHWLSARYTNVVQDENRQAIMASGVHFDIQERKELEASLKREKMLLESLIDNAPFGLYKTRNDGYCEYVNKAYTELTGRTQDEVHGFGWQKLFRKADYGEVFDQWCTGTTSNEPFDGIYPIYLPDGTQKYARVFWAGCHVQAGESAIGLICDATQEIEVKLELEKKTAELEDTLEQANLATRSKSEFLAVISHEIRTPLNGILGMASLMNEQAMSKDDAEMLSVIKDCGRSLLDLINDVLELSKIEAGSLELEYRPIDLRQLVQSVNNMFMVPVAQKDLLLTMRVADQVPPLVMADSAKLKRILVNLVGNSIKVSMSESIDRFDEYVVYGSWIGVPDLQAAA